MIDRGRRPAVMVTGASGYFGRFLAGSLSRTCQVTACYHTHRHLITGGSALDLDITDAAATESVVARHRPDAIIHTAAANPGVNDAAMDHVNVNGSRNIAAAASRHGIRMVHISTDMVHGGDRAPYPATAAPTPINDYGQSKADAEAEVIAQGGNVAIIRTSLIYGLHEMDRGTAGFVKRLSQNLPLILFRDVIRQPVWIGTLTQAAHKLVTDHAKIQGIVNVAGRQAIDRDTFGRRLLDWWGVDYRDAVSSGLANELPSPPPLDLRLIVADTEKRLGMRFHGVDAVLNAARDQSPLD